MAAFESLKFENHERELKYLVENGKTIDIDMLIDFFSSCGYVLAEKFQKDKHETYFDDDNFTLIRSGEVMRGSNYVSDGAAGLMYKKNISDPAKPYVSKLEMGSTKCREIEPFLKLFDLNVATPLHPVMEARMVRTVAIMEADGDRIYLSLDKVSYSPFGSSDEECEVMLEIEDWNTPNTLKVNADYDAHLLKANDLILNSGLPLFLTKDSKPYRGYVLLKNRGLI